MKWKIHILVVLVVSAVAFGALHSCSSGNSSTNSSSSVSAFNLPGNAVKSVPQINGTLASADLSNSVNIDISTEVTQVIQDFFKLECHDDGGNINFCPTGVDASSLDTKFSTTTLIGLVQHADMYLANVYSSDEVTDPETGESVSIPTYKTCEKGTSSAALTNHTPVYDPTNSSAFVVDMGDLFDCAAGFDFGGSKTSSAVYSKAIDNLTFASLTSRKQIQSTASYGGVMSDIFESYIKRLSDGSPYILGSNLASFDEKGAEDSNGRSVLITNFSNNKFIVKYITGVSDSNRKYLVALGKAGYDPSTSTWVTGYYMVKAQFGTSAAETVCVENSISPVIVADSNCSDISGFFSADGWTAAQVYEWLDVGATDQANLAGFNSFIADDEFLSSAATVLPANGTDYFPDTIAN